MNALFTKVSHLIFLSAIAIAFSGCGGDGGEGGDPADSSASVSSNSSSSSVSSQSSNSSSSSSASALSYVPLFDENTALEAEIKFDRGDALVTRFADRGRDRHAKESQFQAYDHYLTFYWENRTIAVEIIDSVAKGGDSITMNVTSLWRLDDTEAENRWFYRGLNTVAEFYDNGTMERHDDYHYSKSRTWNQRENRPIAIGDKIEFEISQFLTDNLPRGRANYYGTTYLYIVGEGLVPWDVDGQDFVQGGSFHQKDSIKIPEHAWLGGATTLPFNHSNEPDNHFMQMATNLSADNGDAFVKGRHVHHSSFVDGHHDESQENGIFDTVVGLSGNRYVNERCTGCHLRNGRALPEAPGVALDKWVFKIADANGNADPSRGKVLQPQGSANEGNVAIEYWEQTDEGLRKPHYQFSSGTPAKVSARIAPQLVGLGLLEAISEEDILALADPNDEDNDGISGRVQLSLDPETGDTRVGRFGWKAGTTSIRHQVASALNTDMGVMTAIFPKPDCGSEQTCDNNRPQLPQTEFDELVKYLSLLGVRPQRDSENAEVMAGQNLFKQIGCEACHTQHFETSPYHPFAELRSQNIQPYSDLLLHDMGPGLADNLGEAEASGAEWRTTPLWSLGLSACVAGGVNNPSGQQGDEVCIPKHSYLHDGRARSIDEAILWHGGEAQASTERYKNLNSESKAQLFRFLESL